MVPTASKYQYYISISCAMSDEPIIYELHSEKINSQLIKINNITVSDNGDYSADVELIGDINNKVSLNNLNETYNNDNFEIVVDVGVPNYGLWGNINLN